MRPDFYLSWYFCPFLSVSLSIYLILFSFLLFRLSLIISYWVIHFPFFIMVVLFRFFFIFTEIKYLSLSKFLCMHIRIYVLCGGTSWLLRWFRRMRAWKFFFLFKMSRHSTHTFNFFVHVISCEEPLTVECFRVCAEIAKRPNSGMHFDVFIIHDSLTDTIRETCLRFSFIHSWWE